MGCLDLRGKKRWDWCRVRAELRSVDTDVCVCVYKHFLSHKHVTGLGADEVGLTWPHGGAVSNNNPLHRGENRD